MCFNVSSTSSVAVTCCTLYTLLKRKGVSCFIFKGYSVVCHFAAAKNLLCIIKNRIGSNFSAVERTVYNLNPQHQLTMCTINGTCVQNSIAV